MMELELSVACLLLAMSTSAVDGLAVNQTDSGTPFVLTYSPVRVYSGVTSNLELRCARNPDVDTSMKKLLWMRVLKYTSNKSWVVVAEQSEGEGKIGGNQEVMTSGRLTPLAQSYLSIVWAETSEGMLGSYKCLTLGLDEHLSFVVDETSEVEIMEKKIAEADLLNIILDTEEKIRGSVKSNQKEILETARILDNYSQNAEQKFRSVVDRFDKANVSADSIIANFLYPDREQLWPAGTYGLLKPEDGCPEDLAFYEGNTGFFTFHTESSTAHPANS